MIDLTELERSLRYILPEWSNKTLAVLADALAQEANRRGVVAHVSLALAAQQLRDHRATFPHGAPRYNPAPAPAEPIHGADCRPPSS